MKIHQVVNQYVGMGEGFHQNYVMMRLKMIIKDVCLTVLGVCQDILALEEIVLIQIVVLNNVEMVFLLLQKNVMMETIKI